MKISIKHGITLFAAVALTAVVPAQAAASLLSQSDQLQLAAWLGEGPLVLNTIYTKAAGDTSLDFHRAADGKGRTFAVMQATNESGQTWLIGGYNPQSWSSSGAFNRSEENAQRTAFLFNLSSGQIHRQTPKIYSYDSVGSYQTFNHALYGPTFGIGHDLYVPADLTHGGYSLRYSYIDPELGDFNLSLLDNSAYTKPNITFGAMEIYTIAAVPEAQTYLMLLAGLGLLGAAARRRSPH